jgi:hypothetical protein
MVQCLTNKIEMCRVKLSTSTGTFAQVNIFLKSIVFKNYLETKLLTNNQNCLPTTSSLFSISNIIFVSKNSLNPFSIFDF